MKKRIIIIVMFFILLTIMFLTTKIYASGLNELKSDTPTAGVYNTISVGQNVIRILTTIGSIVSVVVLGILGIKYMMGSVEERAEYKKTLFPYIIGAGLVFAASTIASIIYNVAITI